MNLINEMIDEQEHSADVSSTSTRCVVLVKTPLNSSYQFLQGPHVHKINLNMEYVSRKYIDLVLILIP